MKYYVLSQKEDFGCPLGMLDAALYDRFYTDPTIVDYGFFSWYTRKCEMKRGQVFPRDGVLFCRDDYYDFDIRGISRFFYVVSDAFLELCNELNVGILECAKIKVLSISGEEISSKKYNAVIFDELDAKKDSDPSSTFLKRESGRPFRIRKLVLPAQWDLDLFKYGRLISGSNSLICSERFMELAREFKGINYTPLNTVLWSGIRAI